MACLNCWKHLTLGIDGLSMFGKKTTTVHKRAARPRSDDFDSDTEIDLESWVVEPPFEIDNKMMEDYQEPDENISIATSRDSGHFEGTPEPVPDTAPIDIVSEEIQHQPRTRSETISTSAPSTSEMYHPEPLKPETVGDLEITIGYKMKKKRLTVAIVKAKGLLPKEHGGALGIRIQIALLPDKLQRGKTRIRLGQDPLFNEVFRFTNLTSAMLQTYALRFRMFGKDKSRQQLRIIGEKVLDLSCLDKEAAPQVMSLSLNAKSVISDPVHPSKRSFLKKRTYSLDKDNSLKINKDPRRARKLSTETVMTSRQVASLVGNSFGKGVI
ncbi:synaptotagmin-14-like [Anneissia japonica]|uniref:synaptotagmin-14-like n=1 Tax=Anneissia japonica TaxID=1529436 RepID=UPI001425A5F4|nr:synaptotagmin-14-like [Anneissia japonica]